MTDRRFKFLVLLYPSLCNKEMFMILASNESFRKGQNLKVKVMGVSYSHGSDYNKLAVSMMDFT